MRLTPSQERFAAELQQKMETHGSRVLFQLDGLDGMGKTTIVNAIREKLGDEALAIIKDSWSCPEHVMEQIDTARSASKVMIVDRLLGKNTLTNLDVVLKKWQMTTEIEKVPALAADDYYAMAAEKGYDLSEQDVFLLDKFSLGIPFLADRILSEGVPILEQCAELYLTAYVSTKERMMSSNGVYTAGIIRDALKREMPEEVLTSPALGRGSALSRVQLQNVDHGIPRCPDTLGVYDAWIRSAEEKRSNNRLSLFVSDVPDVNVLAEMLGLVPSEFPWGSNCGLKHHSRISTLCPGMRKFAIGMDNEFMCMEYHEYAAWEFNQALKNHQLGTCNWQDYGKYRGNEKLTISLSKPANPFFLWSAAHHGDMDNQPAMGLATQTALEYLKLPFVLTLGEWKAFEYKPEQNKLHEIPMDTAEYDKRGYIT